MQIPNLWVEEEPTIHMNSWHMIPRSFEKPPNIETLDGIWDPNEHVKHVATYWIITTPKELGTIKYLH